MNTVYSARLQAHLPLGYNRSTQPNPNSVRLADILADANLPTPPADWGWAGDFTGQPGPLGWGLDGNGPGTSDSKIPTSWAAFKNGVGDCWWAAMAHLVREHAKNAGRPVPPISDLTTVTQYAAFGGCDLETGENDNGTDPNQGAAYLEQHPFTDDDSTAHPYEQVIQIDPTNPNEFYIGCWLFQGAIVGIDFTDAQMTQFDRREPWAPVPGSASEGGHAILVFRNHLISWGEPVPYVESLLTVQGQEAQGFLSLEMFNAVTGEDCSSFKNADLAKYAAMFARLQ